MATSKSFPPAAPVIELAEDFADSEFGEDQDMEPEGYRIVIEVAGTGDMRVGVEPLDMERIPEGDMTSLPDRANPVSNMKPVGTIREALTEALDIYRSQGDLEGMTAGDEAFDEGFGDVEEKRNGLEYRR